MTTTCIVYIITKSYRSMKQKKDITTKGKSCTHFYKQVNVGCQVKPYNNNIYTHAS